VDFLEPNWQQKMKRLIGMLLGVIVKSDNKWFGESNENALER
jgi:hypothetical protein